MVFKIKHVCSEYLGSQYITNTNLAINVQKYTLLQHHQSDYNYAVAM